MSSNKDAEPNLNGDVLSPEAIKSLSKILDKPVFIGSDYSIPNGLISHVEFSLTGSKRKRLKRFWNRLVFLLYNGPYAPKPIEYVIKLHKNNPRAQQVMDLLTKKQAYFSIGGICAGSKPNETGGMDFKDFQFTHLSVDRLR